MTPSMAWGHGFWQYTLWSLSWKCLSSLWSFDCWTINNAYWGKVVNEVIYSFLTLLLINMRMSVMDLKIIQKKIIKSFARINLVIYIFGRLKSYPCKSCPYKMKKRLPVKLNWLQSIRIFDSCCLRLICMYALYCSMGMKINKFQYRVKWCLLGIRQDLSNDD